MANQAATSKALPKVVRFALIELKFANSGRKIPRNILRANALMIDVVFERVGLQPLAIRELQPFPRLHLVVCINWPGAFADSVDEGSPSLHSVFVFVTEIRR